MDVQPVIDALPAPAPRPERAEPASGPSEFDDHLAAQCAEPTDRSEPPAPNETVSDDDEAARAQTTQQTQPPQRPSPAAPLIAAQLAAQELVDEPVVAPTVAAEAEPEIPPTPAPQVLVAHAPVAMRVKAQAQQTAQTDTPADDAPADTECVTTPTAEVHVAARNEAVETAMPQTQDAPDQAITPDIVAAPVAPAPMMTPKAQPTEATRAAAPIGAAEPRPEAPQQAGDAPGPQRAALNDAKGDAPNAEPAEFKLPASALAPAQANAAPAQAQTAQHVSAATPEARPTAAPGQQVTREIVRRFNGQSTEINVRLDPPELGRVDIKLDVSRDHRVTAIVSADNPQALSELMRGARDITQALQSAGLDLADNGLSFDLARDRAGAGGGQSDSPSGGNTPRGAQADDAPAARPINLSSWRGVRVDLVA